MQNKNIESLTALRFFVAFLIVCHHYITIDSFPFLEQIFRNGQIMVDLFFILSGFILAHVYFNYDTVLLSSFYTKRLARIYPLYLIALLIAIPIFIIKLPVRSIGIIATTISVNIFALQAWFPARPFIELHCPLWAVSVEIFFYFLFPFIVKVIKRIKIKKLPAFYLIFICLVLLLIHAMLNVLAYRVFPGDVMLFGMKRVFVLGWLPIVNLPLFLIGIVLCCIKNKIEPYFVNIASKKKMLLYVSIIMLILFILFTLGSTFWKDLELVYKCFLDLMIVVLILLLSLHKGSGIPIFQLLGKSSYSLYVLHFPLWHYFFFVYSRVLKNEDTHSIIFQISYLSFSLVMSVVVWKYIEEPLKRLIVPKKQIK